jgi:hypothetical protein
VELWARILSGNFVEMTISASVSDLLHAVNLRNVTDGFASPLKVGWRAVDFHAFKNPMVSA